MKSEHIKPEGESSGERPFPKLMIDKDDGQVVLFTEPRSGTAVTGVPRCPLGRHGDFWDMDDFTDLPADHQIILQNT